jgi:hypothetical protein
MSILPALASQFQSLFPATRSGQERARWFILTLQAILVPITASRTSNLLRAIATLFGVTLKFPAFHYATRSITKAMSGFRAALPGTWQSIPKPGPPRSLARARRRSANAYSVRFAVA